MKSKLSLICLSILAAFSAVSSFAAEDYGRYFDCWMERIGHVNSNEIQRLGIKTYGDAWICGCYNVEETEGEDWQEGETLTRLNRIWDLPVPTVFPCHAKDCSDTSETFNQSLDQCVDYLNRSGFTLAEFAEGKPVHDAVAQKFKDNGKLTDFGKYFQTHKDSLDKISCFFQYHERPDAPMTSDWSRKGVFSISGLPQNLVPDAIGRMNDYSDVRCKDGFTWTGFLTNGYIENEMHVDSDGKFHGKEIGYGNDTRLPMRQGKEFGKVLYTVEYSHGLKNGPAKFYRYSAVDNIDVEPKKAKKMTPYYFLHLEVPYKLGAVHGMVNMFSQKGFLMAEIPYWDNEVHGRMVVHYPFVEEIKANEKHDAREEKRIAKLSGKKKELAQENFEKLKASRDVIKDKIAIDFKKGQLNGPNDLGYSFGNYREGKLEGKYMTFYVKERCYEWIPKNGIEGTDPERTTKTCFIIKGEKRSWGTFRGGELQGLMECANGIKGKENVDCDNAY